LGAAYLGDKAFGVLNELITATVPAESYCPSAFATVGCTFGVGLPALSAFAVLLGATLPTLGPRLERLIRVIGHWRAYRRLHPLWATLRGALPDVTLAAPDLPPEAPPGGLLERLYRRVVGIRDGLLTLQPYRTPDQRSDPAGHVDQRRAADIEAAHIRAALRRRAHNVKPGNSVVATAPQSDDLASEIRWLTQVSDALARTEPGSTDQLSNDRFLIDWKCL
ncbi:MAG: hypothetical protein LC808_05270, partial [Actinobacteria bacterium]|nr:hypothetical protein [Actinomycetota bacterium]